MRNSRLKALIRDLPQGFIVETPWLIARGIGSRSIHDYVKHGWIERIVRGVYRRPLHHTESDHLSWQVILLSCQHLMQRKMHLGGRNALEYAYNKHSVRLRTRQTVHFYGDYPSWINRLPTKDSIKLHKSSLFAGNSVGLIEEPLLAFNKNYVAEIWHWPVRASCRERAILEMISQIRRDSDFVHVDMQFQSLKFLCPKRLMQLLMACVSIKVKRLFFAFADLYQFPWRENLDPTQIDLGSGPRALFSGGSYHPIYQISLPDFFFENPYEDDCIF
ncbi:MAG: type IV toxin-antitoxin system AbiEi family antitoxin domain-containing protein [Bacteroidetes bacterium]|nr:type IV toxin-antitoxin system AbiEi family antitoxin domain-containing protein [Bacteroidota bacterium]